MFAELAKHDLAKLRAEGYKPTDAEVVALNDLAVSIANGKETTAVNHPRFAFAGNVVLHEPTIASVEWWWSFGHDAAWTANGKLRTHYFSLAFARDPSVFASIKTPHDIRRAVKEWLKGVCATDDELFRAMLYVKHGVDFTPSTAGSEVVPDEQLRQIETLLTTAAGQSGISIDKLRECTQTELFALIRASSKAGIPLKPSTSRAYMSYMRIIREIKARGK